MINFNMATTNEFAGIEYALKMEDPNNETGLTFIGRTHIFDSFLIKLHIFCAPKTSLQENIPLGNELYSFSR
jgi:hypothetical protein